MLPARKQTLRPHAGACQNLHGQIATAQTAEVLKGVLVPAAQPTCAGAVKMTAGAVQRSQKAVSHICKPLMHTLHGTVVLDCLLRTCDYAS